LWWIELFGILRCAQDDGRNLQRQKQWQSSGKAGKATAKGCRVSESSASVDVIFVVRQKRGEDGAAGTGAGVASDPDAAAVPDDDIVCDP